MSSNRAHLKIGGREEQQHVEGELDVSMQLSVRRFYSSFCVLVERGVKIDEKDAANKGATDDTDTMRLPSKSASSAGQREKFRGVYFTYSNTSKCTGKIKYKGKDIHIGSFILQCDAALSYDKTAELLGVQYRNFKSKQDYLTARRRELESREISLEEAGSCGNVAAQIEQHLKRISEKKVADQSTIVGKESNPNDAPIGLDKKCKCNVTDARSAIN